MSVDIWTLTSNADAAISLGDGRFKWLRHEYPDFFEGIKVVKAEDYIDIAIKLQEAERRLVECHKRNELLEDAVDPDSLVRISAEMRKAKP